LTSCHRHALGTAPGTAASVRAARLSRIGARFKFDVREQDGSKVLAQTLDPRFFPRPTVFIGTPDMKQYTIQADVMSDGNRRKMSDVGVVHAKAWQRDEPEPDTWTLQAPHQTAHQSSSPGLYGFAPQDVRFTSTTWW
jgi:hypothetical protein